MTESRHPILIELEQTHADVLTLHPLLDLLQDHENGEDPIMLIAGLLVAIEGRLASIEQVLSLPSSTTPIEL